MGRYSSLALLLPLALSLIAPTANAFPSTLLRRTDLSQQSSCLDLQNYQTENQIALQSDMWDKSDASGYLSDWWGAHDGDTNFVFDFATPWGIGQSFSCQLSDTCGRPSCSSLGNPGAAQAGPAYEVLVSLSNIHQFLKNVRDALQQSQSRWSGLQVAMQKTFWPDHSTDSVGLKEILNAMSAIVGMTMAVASGPLFPVAVGGATAAMVGGIVGAVSNALTDTDHSLDYLAKMEVETDQWYQGALNAINNLNDDLMSIGHHQFPDGSIADVQPLLQGGAWLDFRNIPVLNSDASKPRVNATDLNQMTYNLLSGQLINYAWKQQATWIVKYDMTVEDFDGFIAKSGSNDFRLKLYYGGSAFFFQGLYMDGHIPTAQNPSGWGAIESQFAGALNTNDILRSSADAWHDSGFTDTFSVTDSSIQDPTGLLGLGPKVRGFWNIPVCVPPSDAVHDLDSLNDFLDAPGDWFADGGPYGSNWCQCLDTLDQNGKRFGDQFPPEWEQNMYPNCNPSNPPGPSY